MPNEPNALRNYDRISISEFWANNEPGLEPDAIFDPYINLQAYCQTHGKHPCPEYTFSWFDSLKRSAGELGLFTGLQICLLECKAAGFDIAQVKQEIEDFFSVVKAKELDLIAGAARTELEELLQYGNLNNASAIVSYQILKAVNNAVNAFRFCVDADFEFLTINQLKKSLKMKSRKVLAHGKKAVKR